VVRAVASSAAAELGGGHVVQESRGGAATPSGQAEPKTKVAARVASVDELREGARMARLAMGCYRNFDAVAKEEGLFCVAEGARVAAPRGMGRLVLHRQTLADSVVRRSGTRRADYVHALVHRGRGEGGQSGAAHHHGTRGGAALRPGQLHRSLGAVGQARAVLAGAV
jgi:hypothetical protein